MTPSGQIRSDPPTQQPSPLSRLLPRGSVENGGHFQDMGNSEVLDHAGRHIRFEAGVELPLNDIFFLQANGFGQFGHARRNLGEGSHSSLDWRSFGLNGRVGLSLFDDWFRVSAGIDLGALHAQAPDCADASTCGIRFSGLNRLVPMDNWALRTAGELGLAFFHGAINLYGRFGAHLGLNPQSDPGASDGPPTGLNIANVEIGGAVEVGTFVRMLLGTLPASPPE